LINPSDHITFPLALAIIIHFEMLTATTQALTHEEHENQFLASVLQEQSHVFEEYCHLQTLLNNDLLEEDRYFQRINLNRRTLELMTTLEKVKNVMKLLKSKTLQEEKRMNALAQHLDVSERVLCTLFEHGAKLNPNGIPMTNDNVEIKTVALSTLQASILLLQRNLSM
jgi:AraC-like DNA-binding protein